MGQSFYTCGNPDCKCSFSDYSHNYYSCSCSAIFCSFECADLEENDNEEEEETCCLCRFEKISNEELILFLLDRCKLTKDKAIKLALKESKNGE